MSLYYCIHFGFKKFTIFFLNKNNATNFKSWSGHADRFRRACYPGYEVKQFNIIIDVLGGWSVDVEETMKDLVGQRSRSVMRRMQKVILSHSLNIAQAFKVLW